MKVLHGQLGRDITEKEPQKEGIEHCLRFQRVGAMDESGKSGRVYVG